MGELRETDSGEDAGADLHHLAELVRVRGGQSRQHRHQDQDRDA
jgi:hypothetical protein